MSSPEQQVNGSDQELQERQRVNDVLERMMGELDEEDSEDDGNSNGAGDPRVDWLVNAASANEVAMEDGLWVDEGGDDDDDFYDDGEYDEDE